MEEQPVGGKACFRVFVRKVYNGSGTEICIFIPSIHECESTHTLGFFCRSVVEYFAKIAQRLTHIGGKAV